MNTERLNRISNNIETPNINIDVLNQNNSQSKRSKKLCIYTLNKRLVKSKKKEKFKNLFIVSLALLSVGATSFILI